MSQIGRVIKAVAPEHYPTGTVPGQPAAGHHPYKSRAQWRLFFVRPDLRKWAIGKAHASGGHHEITRQLHYSPAYRALPERRRAPGSQGGGTGFGRRG